MSQQNNTSPLYTITWYTDTQGRKVSYQRLNEQYPVAHGKIQLNDLPDSYYKLNIVGYVEININSIISSTTQYKVNYDTGEVFFDSSKEGSIITILSYYGRGRLLLYAKNMALIDSNNLYSSTNVEDFATEIFNKANTTDTRVNNIVTNVGSSNTEIVDARLDAITSVLYPTLKKRLDDISNRLNSFVFVEMFPSISPELDDTARVQRAINSAPEYSTLVFQANKQYNISCLTITKSLNFDLNGAKFTVDPTTSGTNGSPVFWFTGTLGTVYNLTTCVEKSVTVTLSTFGQGSNFAVGDYVIVGDVKGVPAWDNHLYGGYGGRSEVNCVTSISGDILTLSKPIEWSYDTSPTVTKVTKMLAQPKIYGAAYITEVNPNGVYSGNLTGACPHLFHFQYCIEPEVKDCTFDKWQLHCVNFNYCINPSVSRCSATDPFRPDQGGHGYFMRFDHCSGGVASRNYTRKVRHTVDYVQSYDGHSEYNYSLDCMVTAYAMHGLGAKRCTSSNDTVVGSPNSAGWSMGNYSFSADYSFTIINPKYYGSAVAISMDAKSVGMKIINPQIYTGYIAVVGQRGASGLRIEGGYIEFQSDSLNPQKAIQTLYESVNSLHFGDVSICDTDIKIIATNNATALDAISIASNGMVNIKAKIKMSGMGRGIYIDSASIPTDIDISKVRVTGTCAIGVRVDVSPSRSYSVSDNLVTGYGTNGMYLITSSKLRMLDNYIDGVSNQIAFSGDIVVAKSGGAILFGNTPNTYDGMDIKATTVTSNLLKVSGASGTVRDIVLGTDIGGSFSPRFIIRLNGDAETGSNSGSNLEIISRDDTGASLVQTLVIDRKTGTFTIQGTWDKPLRMSNYRLWIDGSGKPRMKNGAPISDTDGAIWSTIT